MESNLDDLILLKIFDYLCIRTLLRCKQVCKKWNFLIEEQVKNRKREPKTLLFNSNKWIDEEMDKVDFLRELNIQLEYLRFQPEFVLFFLNKTACSKCILETIENDQIQEGKKAKLQKETRISSHLSQILPKCIPKLYVYIDGVIGTSINKSQTIEFESDYEDPCFSGLLLPKSENYRFDLKEICSNSRLPNLETEEEFNRFFGVNSGENLKFLFILVDGTSKIKFRPFLKSLNKIRNIQKEESLGKSFACSGGIVKELENGLNKKIKFVFLSLISNSENVQVAQIVLPDTPQEKFKSIWEEKSEILKSCGIQTENSSLFGLQVSCCGRGREYHNGAENFESSLMLKLYPKLNLTGFYGYGEFGVDHVPDFKDREGKDFLTKNIESKEFVKEEISFCGFTSIFTIISVKNEINI